MLVMVIPMQYVFPFIQAQATRFGVFQMIPPEQVRVGFQRQEEHQSTSFFSKVLCVSL